MSETSPWWETFNWFGWVYAGTTQYGLLRFCTEGLHEVLVNRLWAEATPVVSQHLLQKHIEHRVLHFAGRFVDPCLICRDQLLLLLNVDTYNPSADLAYLGYTEGYKDDRLSS